MKYVFFWVFPRRLSANSRRFGTLYEFHLQRQVNEVLTCLWRWNRYSVPKRRLLALRRRWNTQKKTYYKMSVVSKFAYLTICVFLTLLLINIYSSSYPLQLLCLLRISVYFEKRTDDIHRFLQIGNIVCMNVLSSPHIARHIMLNPASYAAWKLLV
jgi:hypothetical protein